MKNLFYIVTTVCIIAFTSCSKSEMPKHISGTGVEIPQEELSTVTFSVGDGLVQTKAISVNDASISNVQILIFNGDQLIAYGSSNSNKVTIKVRKGIADCYAVVNGDDMSMISSKSALLGKSSLLEKNTTSKMMMFGRKERHTISGNETISLTVYRAAAKVEIDGITTAFTSPAYKTKNFTMQSMTLLNVVGVADIEADKPNASKTVSGVKFNNGNFVSSAVDGLTRDAFKENVVLQAPNVPKPYEVPHYFYCYPNKAATGTEATKLSIETQIEGRTYYYVIEIPAPESNKLYKISNVTITGPGADNPDEVVVNHNVSFSITVAPWGTGFDKPVEF